MVVPTFSRWAASEFTVTAPVKVPVVPVSVPLSIMPPKVGVLLVAMDWGKLNTTLPLLALAITWSAVPVRLTTPVLLTVIEPALLATPMPVPAASVPKLKPLPLPISKVPLAAASPFTPVPPRATGTMPVLRLLALRSVKPAPLPAKVLAVTVPLNVAAVPLRAPVSVAAVA